MFQDEHDMVLCGFFKYLGRCNTYVVELRGVYESLEIARDRGYFRVEYNVDFTIISDTLRSEGMGSVSKGWERKPCHSYYDVNASVDALGNIRSDQETILMF